MNTADQTSTSRPLTTDALQQIDDELRAQGYSFVSGPRLRSSFQLDDHGWHAFSDCWTRLTLDRHMADGGTYRFRRYGAFELATAGGKLRALPHAAYVQPSYINPLNGDVARWFDPLEASFVSHPFLEALLRSLARVFDRQSGQNRMWNVRLHPYRIRARPDMPGLPTPEGLHRDGVDFIVTMMVRRHNLRGGASRLTDRERRPLCEVTLDQPLDILVANDETTMHEVSAIACFDPSSEAYRDVLVVAFTGNP